MTVLEISVDGLPAPQGSHRIGRNRAGKAIILADNDRAQKAWRRDVTYAASVANFQAGADVLYPAGIPVAVSITFTLPRPKSHRHANGQLRDNAPLLVTTKPDVDKLTRSTLDGIGDARIWADDNQVHLRGVTKIYGDKPGAEITLETACRYCGCTDLAGCQLVAIAGLGDVCHWTAPGVCSRCRAASA